MSRILYEYLILIKDKLKYFFGILGLIGITCFEQIQSAFAHSVHCGISGCHVGASGITDWHGTQTAFDNVLHFSVALYGIIMILFWLSLHTKKSALVISRK